MSERTITELSNLVNIEARRRYPEVAKALGVASVATSLFPRLALRFDTPYPYALTEAGALLPSEAAHFGRVVRKSRAEGLREIHSSITAQQEEHAWLFVPEASLWVDHTLSARESDVASDQYMHIFLSHIFPEIEAVHTHPDTVVQKLAHECPWEYSEHYLLEAALPSTPDLLGHKQMDRRTASGGNTISSIVSHYGVTTFSLHKSTVDSGGLLVDNYTRHMHGDHSTPHTVIRGALQALSDKVVQFDGSPAMKMAFEPLV